MPQPNLPPTPLSSTELLAKDLSKSTLDNAFALPPPALHELLEDVSRPSTNSSGSEAGLMSSPEMKTRPRRSSTTKSSNQKPLDLPPPPSRSRKIIQMKPKGAQPADSSAATTSKRQSEPAPVAGSKRKAGGTSTAAGRKIARKTAHSLIERRRRSKMNEEFATLKDMVPACRGHDMHKLAILQASIDYLRYLQDCIVDLKDAAGDTSELPQAPSEIQTSPAFSPISGSAMSTPYLSPEMHPQRSGTGSQVPTPRMMPSDDKADLSLHRSSSWSSRGAMTGNNSVQSTPMMNPQDDGGDLDSDQNEATAALLMLNRDRRASMVKAASEAGGSGLLPPPRHTTLKPRSSLSGMSVRELLS